MRPPTGLTAQATERKNPVAKTGSPMNNLATEQGIQQAIAKVANVFQGNTEEGEQRRRGTIPAPFGAQKKRTQRRNRYLGHRSNRQMGVLTLRKR